MSFGRIFRPNIANYGCSLVSSPTRNFGFILNLVVEHDKRPLGWWKKSDYLATLSPKRVLRVTTDKFMAYTRVLAEIFFDIPYRYLQIVKKRVHMRLITVHKAFVKGTSRSFPQKTQKTQNTSYIERFNLTLRQPVGYLQRNTLGYCKKRVNFNRILWINLYNYNYIQFHKGLRQKLSNHVNKFKKRYQHSTPAMKMALTSGPLSWRFLWTVPIPVTP